MSGQIFPKEETDVPSFVRTVLKEHEKELDRLISKLSEVTEKLSEAYEIVERLERAKEKLETLQSEISNILKCRFDDI